MNKLIIVALLCVVAVNATVSISESEYRDLFSQWRKRYNVMYLDNEEAESRYVNFKRAVDFVVNFPADKRSHTVGLNKFADWSKEEYKMLLGYKGGDVPAGLPLHRLSGMELPTSVNWVTAGAVTPVKNQGQCGSCWSFSTTGAIEGIHYIKSKQLISLSEEELVSCDTTCDGCNGCYPETAMKWVIAKHGIVTEQCYPYAAGSGTAPACKIPSDCTANVTISGVVAVTSGSESALQDAVAMQPVSVAIDANTDDFMYYTGGVLDIPNCPNSLDDLDHAVLAVGYGVDNTKPYWYVKNSWGTDWGVSGYVYMARNAGNMCGIATAAVYPTA